jgi:FKBP-type peptidyl-prolyl cis-trans isomerase SlyD
MKIAPGAHVAMRYRLFDGSGELVESSEDGELMEYVHGEDALAPALEAALLGKAAGDSVRISLPPEEAFGAYDPELLITVPRKEIPEEFELVPGEYLPVSLEEAAEDLADEEIEFRIVEVRESEVVLDANHPLAGETVTFELEVAEVASK